MPRNGNDRKSLIVSVSVAAFSILLICFLLFSACSMNSGAIHVSNHKEGVSSSGTAAGNQDVSKRGDEGSGGQYRTDNIETIDIKSLEPEYIVSGELISRLGPESFFLAEEIPDTVFERMNGVTFSSDCPVTRDELRYIRILHTDAAGVIKLGELVANQSIAQDLCDIFYELFKQGVVVERVRLADDYGGDDEKSMQDNNTSAFNCRPIEGSGAQSRHSYGLAIDINPLYNPYIRLSDGTVLPKTAGEFVDRTKNNPWSISSESVCYQLFTQHGFTWGGDWKTVKDYQHFEK